MKGTSPREMHAQDRRETINFIYNPIFEPPFQNIVNDDLLLGGPSGFERTGSQTTGNGRILYKEPKLVGKRKRSKCGC